MPVTTASAVSSQLVSIPSTTGEERSMDMFEEQRTILDLDDDGKNRGGRTHLGANLARIAIGLWVPHTPPAAPPQKKKK